MAGNWAAEWVNAAAKPNPSLSTWRTPRKSFPDPRVPRVPARSSADPYGVRPARPPISNLKPQDNQINQYPEGVSRGKPAAPAPAAAPRRPMPSQHSTPIPNSAPGFGTTQVRVPASRGRASALNAAAQQAGAGVRYNAVGDDIALAQQTRVRMIGDARAAGGEAPANLTAASENYYNDADIAAWAKANPGLANDLRRKNGLPEIGNGQQAPWAPPNVTWSGAMDQDSRKAYGMEGTLAAPVGKAVPAWNIPAETWNDKGHAATAFDPNVDLIQRETPANYGTPNVPVQTAFNPGLDLMGQGSAPAGYSAANVPVKTAFDPNLDLAGQGQPAAPQYAQAFQQTSPEAQDFNGRYLKQIKGMRPSGMGNIGKVAFNPGGFNSGAGYL